VNPDFAHVQGLAQLVEHLPREFGQLIEKQHAMVGQAQLARAGIGAAADQGSR
jgi:hypothetical protein